MIRISTLAAAAVVAASPAAPAMAQDAGQAQFLATCAACHQPTGQGIKGAFPALAGDRFVQGDPAAVAALVLNGRGGMPRFKDDLGDAQIAAALTFVRSAWGNAAAPVSAAQVAAVRATGAPDPPRSLQAH